MKLKSLLLIFLLAAAVFSTSMFGYIFGARGDDAHLPQQKAASAKNGEESNIPSVSQISSPEEIVKDFKESYILRESDGKIALFIQYANGDELLHSDYEVPVSLLPKSDREELKKGIELNSLSDAIRLVEDYVE